MTKTTGPNFALRSTGAVGNTITHRRSRRRNVASKYSFPSGPPSAAQSVQRGAYRDAVDLWPTIGGANQAWWDTAPLYPTLRTRWHRYLHHRLLFTDSRPFDQFQRPNASTPGYAPTGNLWGTSDTSQWGVSANDLILNARDPAWTSLVFLDPATPDFEASLTYGTLRNGIAFHFRTVWTQDHWRVESGTLAGATITLARLVANVRTVIASAPHSWASGDIITVHAEGPVIQVIINGQPILATTDATHQTATRIGAAADLSAADVGATFPEFRSIPL